MVCGCCNHLGDSTYKLSGNHCIFHVFKTLEMLKSFNVDAINSTSVDFTTPKLDVNRMIGSCQYADAGDLF
jgi:hypothetical protein